MSLFNSVLDEIKNKIESKNSFKKKVAQSFEKIIGVRITEEEISDLKDGVLYIRTSPTLKMSLLLKKDQLIKELRDNGLEIFQIK